MENDKCLHVRFRLLTCDEGFRPYICGAIKELGKWDTTKALPMQYAEDGTWFLELNLSPKAAIDYGIVTEQESDPGTTFRSSDTAESEPPAVYKSNLLGKYEGYRRCIKGLHTEGVIMISEAQVEYITPKVDIAPAFAAVLRYHDPERIDIHARTRMSRQLILRTYAPLLSSYMQLYLVGNDPSLGAWQVEDALPMQFVGNCFWEICLDMDRLPERIEYKFVSRKPTIGQNGYIFVWDKSHNHSLDLLHLKDYDAYIATGYIYQAEVEELERYAGTVIPLSAIRYQDDWGIGDFGGLKKMIDWASLTGQRILQLLPLTDTTLTYGAQDAYPYSPISMYALHPIYVDINALPRIENHTMDAHMRHRAKLLQSKSRVDYVAVLALKNEYLYRHFLDVKSRLKRNGAFKRFVRDNEHWLVPYVSFCILRDRNRGLMPDQWDGYVDFDFSWATAFLGEEKNADSACYYRYIQYLLDEQFRDVAHYARRKGIALKGDLPVGVNRHSATVWTHKDYYNRQVSVGAPPDAFAPNGQNWGFPAVNWNSEIQNDETWMSKRFGYMERFFSAIRIDHVLGIFRTWTIPADERSGLLGQFVPAIGFTADEIQTLGYPFDASIDTCPMLDIQGLQAIFDQECVEAVIHKCLLQVPGKDLYTPLPCFASQGLISEADPNSFPGGERTQKALERFITERPFVTDYRKEGIYHPRYMFEQSKRFELMNPKTQAVWSALNHEYYCGRNDKIWFEQGKQKLQRILDTTSMLVCVEDLGFIPPALPGILASMSLLTLEIERMPKLYGAIYTDLQRLNYLSVCATSTHDIPPLRLWWKRLPEEEKRIYTEQILRRSTEECEELMPDLAAQILTNHLLSPAMLAVFPLSDWMAVATSSMDVLPEEEQINDPTDPANPWDYRMPCLVEDLVERYIATSQQIAQLIETSGRYM